MAPRVNMAEAQAAGTGEHLGQPATATGVDLTDPLLVCRAVADEGLAAAFDEQESAVDRRRRQEG